VTLPVICPFIVAVDNIYGKASFSGLLSRKIGEFFWWVEYIMPEIRGTR
jgi:hypothetical protein